MVLRLDDEVAPYDDVVLRAGGGNVDSLVAKALENVEANEDLVVAGLIRSPYTISVNIPRVGIADVDDILGSAGYVVYKPFLRAEAHQILELEYVTIVATTPTEDGIDPEPLDLCHFDTVIEAHDGVELRTRVDTVRSMFKKGLNPMRPGNLSLEVTLMPDITIRVDFTRLTSAGYGLIYGPRSEGLQVGQLIAITDDDADTIEAEVIEIRGDAAKIRAHWDKVLHRA